MCIPCFGRSRNYVEDVLRAIAETKPDSVHIQHDYTVYGLGDQFFSLLKKTKFNVIVTMHEVHTPMTVEKISYGVENLARDHTELGILVKKIIIHSGTMKKWLVKYGVEPCKVEVIPHGTPILPRVRRAETKRALGFSETDKVILSLGFIRRSKNDCLLIEALPEVLREAPNTRLLLVGSLHPYSSREDIEEIERRRSAVDRLGLNHHVRFIQRYVDENELPSIFGCADVLVYLHDKSYVEVSGALHLGIGAGKPIVVTAVPRFEEIQQISPETVLHPGQKQQLVEILSRILTDDDFAEEVAGRIAAYASQTSWTNVATEHYRIYQEIGKQNTQN